MKTFQQFCEGNLRKIGKHEKSGWVHKSPSFGTDYNHVIQHHARVGKHKVLTHFVHGADHHWEVHFQVDNSIKAKQNFRQSHMDVLHHVQKTIHRFIKNVGPKSISLHGNSDQKHKMYGAFAQKLAKQHNAEYENDENYQRHRVIFR